MNFWKDRWKKSFPVDYDNICVFPSKLSAIDAVARHCGHRNWTYVLLGEDESGNPLVEIEGVQYRVLRRPSGRAGYSIFCREV